MMNRFEDILAKKEEACVRRSEITEEKKAEMFTLLMDAADKKLTLEERRTMIEERKTVLVEKRVMIAANAEDAKMLTLDCRLFGFRCKIHRAILWKPNVIAAER
ncbi:hypothetical protein D1007_46245 [Hordeum vulgare]|nr:hypothetical protein D1007_46245 [Hordeum vulgare]